MAELDPKVVQEQKDEIARLNAERKAKGQPGKTDDPSTPRR